MKLAFYQIPIASFIFILQLSYGTFNILPVVSDPQVPAEQESQVQLDKNAPPVVVSEELMYKSDTDERYTSAEKAITGGGKSKEDQLKEAYDFDTFYSPEKWQPMLDDTDYEEMEEDMKKRKAAKWATKKTQAQLDMEEDDEAEDEPEDFDEMDYEAKDVPAADVQLDSESEVAATAADKTDAAQQATSNDEKNTETAEEVTAWMDEAGGDPDDPELAIEGNKEENVGTMEFFRSLLPGGADKAVKISEVTETKTKTVVIPQIANDVDLEDYKDKEDSRRKRSPDGGDDDYSEVELDNASKNTAAGRVRERDDEYKREVAFDADDYSNTEQTGYHEFRDDNDESEGDKSKALLDDDDDYSEESARQQIDREYDDGESVKSTSSDEQSDVAKRIPGKNSEDTEEDDRKSDDSLIEHTAVVKHQKGIATNGDNLDSVDEVRTTRRRTKEAGYVPADRLRGADRQRMSEFDEPETEPYSPDNDQTQNSELDVNQRDYNRGSGKTRQKDQRSVAIALGNRDGEASSINREISAAGSFRRRDKISEDNDFDEAHRSPAVPSRARLRPAYREAKANSAKDRDTIADLDTDVLSRRDFEQFDRKQNPPSRRGLLIHPRHEQPARDVAKRAPAYLVPEDRKIARAVRRLKNRVVFDGAPQLDDDYQFDEQGTIKYAREQVCKFVATQLSTFGFTGKMQGGKTECDVECERTDGKAFIFHTFHLKNWPCGENQKGRCSNDGKCDSTSVAA